MTTTISPTLPLTLAGTATLTADPSGVGAFIALTTEAKASARQVFVLGSFSAEVTRWTCCRRYEPYWMVPAWGQRGDAVPRETQYLLAELSDGRVARRQRGRAVGSHGAGAFAARRFELYAGAAGGNGGEP